LLYEVLENLRFFLCCLNKRCLPHAEDCQWYAWVAAAAPKIDKGAFWGCLQLGKRGKRVLQMQDEALSLITYGSQIEVFIVFSYVFEMRKKKESLPLAYRLPQAFLKMSLYQLKVHFLPF
jgi:hypothetical protein